MLEYFINKGYFRNANHGIWFVNSLFFLAFSALFFWGKLGNYVLLFPIAVHISPIINSVRKIILKQKSEIYSVDCIWFNALMILGYIILWIIK